MTDESNGESTFEFVEKRAEDASLTENVKSDSISSLSSSASLLPPLAASTSAGSLLSNIAPPSALPSFVARDDAPGNPIEANVIVQTTQPLPSTSAPAEVNVPLEAPGPELGVSGALLSWVKETVVNNSMLNKVAERAKSSVNSMITTLDPQMREFIYSGGDVEVIVASNREIKISPVREAFQGVFGKATVSGVPVDTAAIPKQPVGFGAGIAAAEMRIKYARNAHDVPRDVPIVAVQSFVLEVGEDKWYELAVILLEDQKNNVNLQMFTQMTPVPSQIVATAKEATPDDYPLKSVGLAASVGVLMATNLQVPYNEWHHALTGVSRRDTILLAAQSLAGIYKNTISTV